MRIEISKIEKGEIIQFAFDFSVVADKLSTSVSSADWTTEDTSILSLGTEALASNRATCLVTGSNVGCGMLKVSATMADGQKIIRKIKVSVDEAKC